ncbi:MAG: hypothetical protein ACTHJX_10075, partial [Terriglobales bacterium]
HPPLSHAVDVSLSGQVLGRQVEAQCSDGLPQACGKVPLYVWNLNRALVYGAQIELRSELTPWPESAPPLQAMVVMDRTAVSGFVARYGAAFDMARLSRFEPPPPGAARWVVVRLRRH